MSNEPHHLGHQIGSDSISQAGHRAHTFTPRPHTPRPPRCWGWVNVRAAAQRGDSRGQQPGGATPLLSSCCSEEPVLRRGTGNTCRETEDTEDTEGLANFEYHYRAAVCSWLSPSRQLIKNKILISSPTPPPPPPYWQHSVTLPTSHTLHGMGKYLFKTETFPFAVFLSKFKYIYLRKDPACLYCPILWKVCLAGWPPLSMLRWCRACREAME